MRMNDSLSVFDQAANELFEAVGKGDPIAAADALAKGAVLSAVSEKQTTPLMVAMINSDSAMVKALLKHGADPNQKVGDNFPPLVLAAKIHIPRLYSLLSESGPNDDNEPAEPCIRLLVEAGADLRNQGPEAAMIAVTNRAVSTLVALDEAGLDWKAIYKDVENPAPLIDLLFGLATERPGSSDDVVAFCLRHGAQKERSTDGRSPLMNVLRKVNLDDPTFRKLLNAGVDVNATDAQGLTPLMIAAALGHEEAFVRLIEKGANPWQLDSQNRCALHWAAAYNRNNIIEYAISLGLHKHAMPVARIDHEPLSLDALAPQTCFALQLELTPGYFSPIAFAPDVKQVQIALSERFGNYRAPQGPFLILQNVIPDYALLRPTNPFAHAEPFIAQKGDYAVTVLSGIRTIQDMIYQPNPANFIPVPILAVINVCQSIKEAQSRRDSLPARTYVAQLVSILTLDEGYPIEHGSMIMQGGDIVVGA
jgi:ankyrin repeat protein